MPSITIHPRQKRREEIRTERPKSNQSPFAEGEVYFTGNTDMQQDHNRFIKTHIIKALVLFHQTTIHLIFEIDSLNVHVNSIACKSLWYEEQIHALLFDFNGSYERPNRKKSQPIKNLPPETHININHFTIFQYPLYIYIHKDLWEEQVWGCDTLKCVPATKLFSSESVFPSGKQLFSILLFQFHQMHFIIKR